MTTGEKVKQLRESLNLSQNELAFRAGISHTHVRALEMNGHAPTVRLVKALAAALGVPASVLIEDDDETPSEDPTLDDIAVLARSMTAQDRLVYLHLGRALRFRGAMSQRVIPA